MQPSPRVREESYASQPYANFQLLPLTDLAVGHHIDMRMLFPFRRHFLYYATRPPNLMCGMKKAYAAVKPPVISP